MINRCKHNPCCGDQAFCSRAAAKVRAIREGDGEVVNLRSYLAWAVAQIEVMNDGKELSVSEWAEDAAMFWQAKQMSMGNNIEHLLHDEDAHPKCKVCNGTGRMYYGGGTYTRPCSACDPKPEGEVIAWLVGWDERPYGMFARTEAEANHVIANLNAYAKGVRTNLRARPLYATPAAKVRAIREHATSSNGVGGFGPTPTIDPVFSSDIETMTPTDNLEAGAGDLVARLRDGLVLVGESESDDGTIELFDTDEAATLMAEGADLIELFAAQLAAVTAENARLRERIEQAYKAGFDFAMLTKSEDSDLAAENARLRGERDALQRESQAWADNALRGVGELRVLAEGWKARATTAEAENARLREGWQDIESAPKDGTTFLAYNSFMGQYTTCFTTMWIDGSLDYEGFPCGFVNGMFGAWDCQPTHWQPLPPPPAALSQEATNG